ncbi:MAG: hypothetical protein RIR95_993 [Pseudomonadota bacterium]
MISEGRSFSVRDERSQWLRLRSSILLRWIAIGGQIAAIFVAAFMLSIRLPLGLCLLAVGLAVAANLTAAKIFPANKRLSEPEAVITLAFDLAQLSFLLFLTGGLSNPFAVLILAPVTISASALELRATILIGVLAGLFATILLFFNMPLVDSQGKVLLTSDLFAYGFWSAILIGVAFLAGYLRRVSTEIHSMSDALLATQLALSREQKLTDLGGVIAAAAHELGTPLSTIKLVSAELIDELHNFPALQEDARLLLQQADRCRDILRSMGRAGKDDLLIKQALFGEVLREASEPHLNRGRDVTFTIGTPGDAASPEPIIRRLPALIHGIRNLAQNAVDFAQSKVWIEASWTDSTLTLIIRDDGPGFSPQILGRIGDPFLSSRKAEHDRSELQHYEGMGLGLFIAKTLLERTGAVLTFANVRDIAGTEPFEPPHGALVKATWPLIALQAENVGLLGDNPLLLK